MIGIYEGEHALAADNRLVGVLQVTGLPLTEGREREILITVEIDVDGVAGQVELEVREDATGHGRPRRKASTTRAPQPERGAVIEPQPSPEASQAAREHGLGKLRLSFTEN